MQAAPPVQDENPAPSRRLAFVGLGIAIVGGLAAMGGLFLGILAGLGGTGDGATASMAIFYVGVGLLVVALGLAVFQLVRRSARALPIVTILLCFSPVLFIVGLRSALGA